GLISVTPGADAAPVVTISRGKKDDPIPNSRDVLASAEPPAGPPEGTELPKKPTKGTPTTAGKGTPKEQVATNVPSAHSIEPLADVVEVTAKIPHAPTRVRVTIDVVPGRGMQRL